MRTNYIEKLLSIGSGATADSGVVVNLDEFDSYGRLAGELLQMLRLKNGFYAFESALQLYPAAHFGGQMTLSRWNAHDLWKFEYEGLADNKLFFAQEAFGNQFCISQERIWFFDSETGKLDYRADSLDGWAEIVLTDYGMQTGYSLMHKWQKEHGRIASGHRLMPKIPFVLGGQYELGNLYSLNAVSAMKSRGNLAKQIKELPDGAKVQFRIIN